MPRYTVRILHWVDFDDGYLEGTLEVEVDAADEAAAVAAVRGEYPEHSWDAYALPMP